MPVLLSCVAGLALAEPGGMCRQMCSSEKTQCVRDIARPGWLESARMFIDNHASFLRVRQEHHTDSGLWLQQRQDKHQNEKNMALEQKQQCDSSYLQCTMACTDPGAAGTPQAPASAPLNPSLMPQ